MSPTRAAAMIGAGMAAGGGGAPPMDDLLAWYDASVEAYGDTDPVPTWTDQVGPHELGAGGAEQPTFLVNQINGLPALDFDGVANTLQDDANAGAALNADLTIAAVLKLTSTAHEHSLLCAGAFFAAGEFNLMLTTALKARLDRPFVDNGVAATAGLAIDTWGFITVHVSGTDVAHYLNGSANGTDTLATGTSTTDAMRMRLNSGSPRFEGQLAELLVYSAAIPAPDLAALHSYLAGKYGL